MKKLSVNGNCIGCGACVAIDPEHFDFNENGLSTVIKNENLDTPEVNNAISSCPVGAIKIEDCCSCKDDCHCNNDCHCADDCHCGE